MSDKILVNQPTAKPTRKLRAGGYILAGLTVATYVVGAITGEAVIDEDAGMQALGVLLSGGIPWLTAYFTRNEA